jgi:hypothetical protein
MPTSLRCSPQVMFKPILSDNFYLTVSLISRQMLIQSAGAALALAGCHRISRGSGRPRVGLLYLKAFQCALSDGERGFRQTINEFVQTRAVGHGSIVFTVVLSANRK